MELSASKTAAALLFTTVAASAPVSAQSSSSTSVSRSPRMPSSRSYSRLTGERAACSTASIAGFGQKRAPQIGVDYHAGRVDYALERGLVGCDSAIRATHHLFEHRLARRRQFSLARRDRLAQFSLRPPDHQRDVAAPELIPSGFAIRRSQAFIDRRQSAQKPAPRHRSDACRPPPFFVRTAMTRRLSESLPAWRKRDRRDYRNGLVRLLFGPGISSGRTQPCSTSNPARSISVLVSAAPRPGVVR